MTSTPTSLRVAIVAATIVLTVPATAQKITAEGIARSASLYAAIVEFCPATQRVDIALATKAAKAMTDAANEALGPDAGPTTLDNEFKRRFDEVRAQSTAWCANQARQPAIAALLSLAVTSASMIFFLGLRDRLITCFLFLPFTLCRESSRRCQTHPSSYGRV